MSKSRVYHYYPKKAADIEQRFYYRQSIPYFVHTMALMHKKFGSFTTHTPDARKLVNARREINVEIAEGKTEFTPLTPQKVEHILREGELDVIDFKIRLNYTYLDDNYRSVPFKGDTYLLRANFIKHQPEKSLLTLRVHHIDGPGKTECIRIIDTVIHELESNAGRLLLV